MEQVKITYLGQCGFLLEGAGVKIVTDPYLSDYVDRNFYSEKNPWKRLYEAPISLQDIDPDLIIISHAHGDHMDPYTLSPYFAIGGKSQIAAPAPECGNLYDMGAKNAIEARAEHPFTVKGVNITPIPCAHTSFHTDDQGRFHELSYLIDFGNGNIVFFGGDMSLYDGLDARLMRDKPAVMLLPVNGRDEIRTNNNIIGNTTAEEAAALSKKLNVPFIPMHHDLYEINRCPEGYAESAAKDSGAEIHPLALMKSIWISNGKVHA